MTKRKTSKITPKEAAISNSYFAAFVGFMLAYFVAEASLYGRPHPLHWVVALSGAVLAGVFTYLIVLRHKS